MNLEKFKVKNSKKQALIIGSIILVLLITIVIIYQSFAFYENKQEFNVIKGSVPEQNYDIMLSLTKEDENGNKVAIDKIPEKSEEKKYEVSITCNNEANGVWNYDEWKPDISNFTTARTKCTMNFKENNEFVYPVVEKIDDFKKAIADGKKAIANAITQKGIATNSDETFASMAQKIGNIKTTPTFSEASYTFTNAGNNSGQGYHTVSHTFGQFTRCFLVSVGVSRSSLQYNVTVSGNTVTIGIYDNGVTEGHSVTVKVAGY